MKNDSLDPKTPFLAFYDLLRIRGIYSTEEKREKLRRGFRRAMALAATLVAFALPQGARASVLGDLLASDGVDGKLPAGSYTGLGDGTFMTDGDDVTISGTGKALFQTDGAWVIDGGTLTHTDWVYLLAHDGLTFSGGTLNVGGLVAAAMGSFDFETTSYGPGDVGGDVSISGTTINAAASKQVFIGQAVSGAASGATIVATAGMSEGATFAIADNGAKITFTGSTGAGTKLEAPNVVFKENVEIAGGDVNASTGISGADFTQSAGSITTAGTVDAKVTQNGENATLVAKTVKEIDQTAGTITVESVTGAAKAAGTLNGVTDAGLTVGSMELGSTANVDAKGALVIQGAGTLDGTVVADSVTADGQTLTFKSNAGLSDTSVTAGTAVLDAGSSAIGLNALSVDTLQGTAGNVTVKNGKDLDVAGLSAAGGLTLDAGANAITQSGAITVSGGAAKTTLTGGSITLENSGNGLGAVVVNAGEGDVSLAVANGMGVESISRTSGNVTLDGGSGKVVSWPAEDSTPATISIGSGTLSLKSDTEWDGKIVAGEIDASGKTLSVESSTAVHTADIDVSGTVTASAVEQTGGSFKAGTLDGTLTKTGGDAEIGTIDDDLTLNDATDGMLVVGEITGNLVLQNGNLYGKDGSLEVGGTTQQSGGVLGGIAIVGDGQGEIADNITLTGALTQTAGTINAGTLTLGADGNAVAGTVNADAIAGGKAIEVQDGGDVNATAIAAELTVKDGATVDTKSGAGTLAITGNLVQDGGQVATMAGENVTVSGTTTQNSGTLGNATGTAELTGKLTQTAGEIDASTLTLRGGADQSGGAIAAKDLVLASGANDVALQKGDNDFDTVSGAAGNVAITDTDDLTVTGENGITASGDARLVAGAGALTVGGMVEASGDILLQSKGGEVKATADVSGKNVTVNAKTSSNIAGNTTATEDLYVKAGTGNVKASGDLTGNKMLVLEASQGSVTVGNIKSTTGTFVSQDKNGTKVEGNQDTKTAVINTKSSYESTKIAGGSTISVKADGNVKLGSDGEIKVGTGSTAGGGALDVTEVTESGTKETPLSVATEAGKVSGVTSKQGNVDITAAAVSGGPISAGGTATVTARSGDITSSSISGGNTKVEAQQGSVNSSGEISGKSSVAVTAAKDVKAASITGGKVEVEAKSGEINVSGSVNGGPIDLKAESGSITADSVKGGDVTVKSGDNTTITKSLEGDKVVLDVGGDLEAGDVKAKTLDAGDEGQIAGSATFTGDVEVDEAILAVGDDLLFEGTVTAKSIDASEEGVGSATFQGDVTADTMSIKASDSIKTEGATITTSDSISLDAGGDVDVTLKSKKIEQIKGKNVTIVETATDTVSLGLLQAGGDLSLTSKKAGFSDGNGGQPNLVVEHGSATLDIGGSFGSAADPMEARLSKNGTLTIKNGEWTPPEDDKGGFIHVIIETDDPSAVPEVVYDDPIGLVLVNRQIRGGDPRLIRRMNRALAFTVNTPELKSSQGVFGDAAFIHTGMDISEARSIGSVGALSLDVQDYHGIFDDLTAPGTGFGKMSPPILPGKSPLKDKIDQAETPASQPDVKNFQD